MEKPRIIIADEDSNYIVPLQFKFVADFFNKIDLEVISDREYFESYFMKPRNAEILIVSEDLYDISLQKHNIANIFVMMEQLDEADTGDLNVNKIFKYTGIKEIFNEIIGKSAGVLDIGVSETKETQIILVTSAAGGVGKTTVALGVSASLSKNYKRALYINAERMQSFQFFLNNKEVISAPDIYGKLINPSDRVYEEIKHVIRNEAFSYLPPFKAALISVGIDYSVYKRLAVAAKKSREYDFIVIDAESTFDENKTDLIDVADKVVVVTDQTSKGVQSTNCMVSNLNGINPEKYVFVCNRFDKDSHNALIASESDMKFTINEYVERFEHYEQLGIDDFSKGYGIQRTAFLII